MTVHSPRVQRTALLHFGHFFFQILLHLLLSCLLPIFWFLNLYHFLILAEHEERGKFGPSDGSDKGKSIAKETGKRAFHRTRIGMDFD